jgi:hypothetical protein
MAGWPYQTLTFVHRTENHERIKELKGTDPFNFVELRGRATSTVHFLERFVMRKFITMLNAMVRDNIEWAY